MGFIRDPRYWVPFVALLAIIAVAAVMRNSGSSEAEQVVVTPTPAATSTPDPSHTPTIDETLLDARRVFDIAAAQKALAAYHNEHRSYPSTGGAFVGVSYTFREERLWLSITPQYFAPIGQSYYPPWALSGLPWAELGVPVTDHLTISLRLGETLLKAAYTL